MNHAEPDGWGSPPKEAILAWSAMECRQVVKPETVRPPTLKPLERQRVTSDSDIRCRRRRIQECLPVYPKLSALIPNP